VVTTGLQVTVNLNDPTAANDPMATNIRRGPSDLGL
jgi:hypothetical protein